MILAGRRGHGFGASRLVDKPIGFQIITNSGSRSGFSLRNLRSGFGLWQSSCMLISSPGPQEQAVTLTLLEGGLTAIVLGLVFAWPRLGASWFSRIERSFGRLARRKVAAVL